MADEEKIGRITHFYDKISVAIIHLTHGPLAVGDTIRIKGHTTDFTQQISSMEFEHQSITQAQVGQQVGVKVPEKVRVHDEVYRVTG